LCTGTASSYLLQPTGALAATNGRDVYPITPQEGEHLIPLLDIGLHSAPPEERAIYEGDIISFTIRGATHGREPDHCAAAHVWWCQEDGYWAFGRWTQKVGPMNGETEFFRTWDWWYTMEDDIDRSTIKVLGNIFQNPELLPLLGYIPQL
jgi:hypothetical protein